MKNRITIPSALSMILLFTLLGVQSLSANPIAIPSHPPSFTGFEQTLFLVFLFIPIVLLEFGIVCAFFQPKKQYSLLIIVFLVHLVTYPFAIMVSQVLVLSDSAIVIVSVAEILVIYLEYVAYTKVPPHWLNVPNVKTRCLGASMVANLLSFLIGLAILSAIENVHTRQPSWGPRPDMNALREAAETAEKERIQSIVVAIEAYTTDHGEYPTDLISLSTPVAYIEADLLRPMLGNIFEHFHRRYCSYFIGNPGTDGSGVLIFKDRTYKHHAITERIIAELFKKHDGRYNEDFTKDFELLRYDPTNGATSKGYEIIFRTDWQQERKNIDE